MTPYLESDPARRGFYLRMVNFVAHLNAVYPGGHKFYAEAAPLIDGKTLLAAFKDVDVDKIVALIAPNEFYRRV